MAQDVEKHEKSLRAARLKEARIAAGYKGPKDIAERLGWNANNYKAHEYGRNGFGISDAKRFAKAFGVSANWLMFGNGKADDLDNDVAHAITDVPIISWVSAGEMRDHHTLMPYDDFPTTPVIDLPDGDWFALKVDGNSMNKISPPDSIIIGNRRDKRLVVNACYVVADETGAATYKRYRPTENPPFQPASYEEVAPPVFVGEVKVIGRVRRSMIDM